MKRQNIIAKSRSDIYLNPVKLGKFILKDKTAINRAALAIPTIIATTVMLPGTILEGLLVSPFRKGTDIIVGEMVFPEQLRSEDLLGQVDRESQLRQSFYDQHSDHYSLHRLDIIVMPNLINDLFRIMRLKVTCTFDNECIECTDVFPQTKWVYEGLNVGDQVFLNTKGEFDIKPKSTVGALIGNAEVGRNYFYALTYSTLVPEIIAKYSYAICGWTMNGTYAKYIADDTKHLVANLLVPKKVTHSTATIGMEVGVTDIDRRMPDSYPATRSLQFTRFTPQQYKLQFNEG